MDMILGRQRKTSRSSRWGMFLIMVKRRRGTRRRLSRWLTDSWVYVLGSMGGWISECSRWKAAETKAVEEGGTYTSRPPRGTVFAMVTIPSSNSRFNVYQISVWGSSCRTLSSKFFGLDSLGIHSTIVNGGDEPDLIFLNSRPRLNANSGRMLQVLLICPQMYWGMLSSFIGVILSCNVDAVLVDYLVKF